MLLRLLLLPLVLLLLAVRRRGLRLAPVGVRGGPGPPTTTRRREPRLLDGRASSAAVLATVAPEPSALLTLSLVVADAFSAQRSALAEQVGWPAGLLTACLLALRARHCRYARTVPYSYSPAPPPQSQIFWPNFLGEAEGLCRR